MAGEKEGEWVNKLATQCGLKNSKIFFNAPLYIYMQGLSETFFTIDTALISSQQF